MVENHEWNEASFNWIDTIINFRKMGFNHNIFVSIFVGPDFKNSTRHVAQVSRQSSQTLERKLRVRGKTVCHARQ